MDVEGTTNEKPTRLGDYRKGEEKDTVTADLVDVADVASDKSEEFKTIDSPVLEVPDGMDLYRANELQGMLNTWWPTEDVQIGGVHGRPMADAEHVGIYLDGSWIGEVYGRGETRGPKAMFDFTDFRSQVTRLMEIQRKQSEPGAARMPSFEK